MSFYPEMSCREIPKICAAFYFFFRLQLLTGSQHVDADNLLKNFHVASSKVNQRVTGSVANRVGIRDLLASCNQSTPGARARSWLVRSLVKAVPAQ